MLKESLTFDGIGFKYCATDNTYKSIGSNHFYYANVWEARTAVTHIELISIDKRDNSIESYLYVTVTNSVGEFIESYLSNSRKNDVFWNELTGHFISLYRNDVIDSLLLDI